MSDGFSSELDQWLHATADRYEVAQTLKESPCEKTQVVYRRDNAGESVGPFVRKVFIGDTQRGHAYELILRAQTSGTRLEHQPFVYDCEHVGDTLEVVMEYVHGTTLRDEAQGPAAGEALLRRVFAPLCDAVAELHERFDEPVIHRDIKPSNVMLANGRTYLIDLGIARTWHEGAPRDTVRYGTPGYAPPEQFGYGQTSVRSDIYALGMTLAYCLLGADPSAELREAGFQDPRIPPSLQPILTKATQFDPSARYASARELMADVSSVLALDAAALARTAGAASGEAAPLRFERLGKVWNAFLAMLYILDLVVVLYVVFSPQEETGITSYSIWFRAFSYLTMWLIPITCAMYLLLDKRRLRSHPLFAGRTLVQEFLVCFFVSVVCAVIGAIVYGSAIQPTQ